MIRCTHCVVLTVSIFAIAFTGCGKATNDVAQSAPTAQQSVVASQTKPASQASPTEVVSEFLNLIRQGGENTNAGSLLTTKAQEELKRIGRSVNSIGFPEVKIAVTRAEPVPGEDNAMFVQSFWTEPMEDGSKAEFEVVWMVQLEQSGWRISGLAMENQPGAPPINIDFEDSALMSQMLPPNVEENGVSQAANPTQEMVR